MFTVNRKGAIPKIYVYILWVSICLSLFLPVKVNRERAPQPSCCSEFWQGPGPSMRLRIKGIWYLTLLSYELYLTFWPPKVLKIECISIPWHQMHFFFSVLQAWNVCHCQWQSEELIADFQKGFVHLFRLQIRAASTTFITQSHSIYSIFTYIWLIFMVNVGKYTIHGWYGQWYPNATLASFLRCCFYSKQRDEDYAPFDRDDTRLWLALKDGVSVRFPIEYPIVPVLT